MYMREIAYIEVPRGYVHVEGIGPKKAQALLAWKQQAEKKIASYMPKSLTPAQENAIKSKYISERQSLDYQEADAKKRAVNSKDACKAKFRKEQEDLKRQLSEAEKAYDNMLKWLDKEIAEKKKNLSDMRWKTGMVEHKLKSYAPITFGSYLHRAFLG